MEDSSSKKTKQGKCYQCLMKCCNCCMACIERCIEYINKHAYIEIALKGKNFCKAAWEGFALIVRNLGRFSALEAIGKIFNAFGIIFVAGCSGLIGFLCLEYIPYFKKQITSAVLPVFATIVVGFVIGSACMNVFGVSSDALMHCFLVDEEINKGQAKCFPELQKFMEDERE